MNCNTDRFLASSSVSRDFCYITIQIKSDLWNSDYFPVCLQRNHPFSTDLIYTDR